MDEIETMIREFEEWAKLLGFHPGHVTCRLAAAAKRMREGLVRVSNNGEDPAVCCETIAELALTDAIKIARGV